MNVDDNKERKTRRRFQDALPVENSSATDTKVKSANLKDGSHRKVDPDNTKQSDQMDAPWTRSHFQVSKLVDT